MESKLRAATKEVIAMNFLLSEDEKVLGAMGLKKAKREDGREILVIKLNHREFWELDVENALCKIVTAAQRTGGAHAGSITIQMHNRKMGNPFK